MPCVYVAGNHEFYKGLIRERLEEGRRAAQEFPGVHFLENDPLTMGGIQFFGAALSTVYRIEGYQPLAICYALERLNDYRQLAVQRRPWLRSVRTPRRGCTRIRGVLHRGHRLFASNPAVVVTHHLPQTRSLPDRSKGDLLNATHAFDLTEIIHSGRPALWMYG